MNGLDLPGGVLAGFVYVLCHVPLFFFFFYVCLPCMILNLFPPLYTCSSCLPNYLSYLVLWSCTIFCCVLVVVYLLFLGFVFFLGSIKNPLYLLYLSLGLILHPFVTGVRTTLPSSPCNSCTPESL